MNHKINKKELTFISASVILFIVLAASVFYLINFLATKINSALTLDSGQSQQLVRFDIETFQKIKAIKQ